MARWLHLRWSPQSRKTIRRSLERSLNIYNANGVVNIRLRDIHWVYIFFSAAAASSGVLVNVRAAQLLTNSLGCKLHDKGLGEISPWMSANLLTLNSSKTEFLIIGLKQQLSKIDNSSLTHSFCTQSWFYLWWTFYLQRSDVITF